MTKNEHLLVCLTEECSEIQKAVAKALRFGLEDGNPQGNTTNATDIMLEINDLIAVVELLEEEKVIPMSEDINLIDRKKAKIKHYVNYAIKQGTVVEKKGGAK